METIQPYRYPEEEFHGVTGAVRAAEPVPWEQIELGRYQPRRIRGSYRGRELG